MNSVRRSLNGCFVRAFCMGARVRRTDVRVLLQVVGLNGCSHSLNDCFVQEDVWAERMFVFAERCSVPVLKKIERVGNADVRRTTDARRTDERRTDDRRTDD